MIKRNEECHQNKIKILLKQQTGIFDFRSPIFAGKGNEK